MYPISALYTEYLKRHDREFLVKADITGTEYSNDVIVDFTIENSLVLGEEFEIGTTILSKLTIKLRTEDVIAPNARIVPYLSLRLPPELAGAESPWQDVAVAWQDAAFPWGGAQTEWMPLGEFYVDSREKINDTWVYTCYDRLVWADVAYISSLTYPTTQQAVWDEICGKLGYTYDSSVTINPAYQIQAGPAGYSIRQVLGYIASANSASVFVGKDGKIKFRRFTASDSAVFEMTASDYIRAAQTNPVKTYTRVVVMYDTEDELTYEAGTGDDNHTLFVENPFATQEITNDLLSAFNGFSYQPVNMDARGFPQIEAGDRIRFGHNIESLAWQDANTAWEDTAYSWDGYTSGGITLALHNVFSFKGGLKMSVEAPSKSEQQSEFVVEGSLTQQVNRMNRDAVRLGKSYYGATLTRTEGLTIEREDHASKVILNSDKLSFQAGGVDKIYFDTVAGKYKFNGTLEASDGVFSGSLSAATGTFSGNLSAAGGTFSGTLVGVDGTFSGTITASSISGGTITGALIQTAESGIFPRSEMSSSNDMIGVYGSIDKFITLEALDPGYGVPLLQFSNGAVRTDLYQFPALFIMQSNTDMLIDSTNGEVRLGGTKVRIGSWNDLISTSNGGTLQQALDSKAESSAVNAKADLSYVDSNFAYNMAFDNSTRNLKIFSRNGVTLATVNIP
ncbi:hypothetical protein [Cohnella luojiensis]|uniref:Prophage tail endopeptidase domain-containing protein n=1 Tax=Cohnella luojiensis TaxID=652876 RepID=A0A4Y8M5B6_9BACL|nr:hypothetical protein [Cohnella luojiensis]TFE30840.1 hypothetical protein E2980_03425 [Cohnella luojiensis]